MNSNYLLDGLRTSGVKLTAQRRAICEWLAYNEMHPNASAVYNALRPSTPGLSLATVYNTLTLLESLDLIHEVTRAEDGSTRYDPNTQPHVNLVCTRCGSITDQSVLPIHLERLQQAAQAQGFRPRDTSVVLHGLCANCLQGHTK